MSVLDNLITNRTYEDILALRELRKKIANGETNVQYWNTTLRGALNYNDLNRIGNALLYMQSWLADNGISVSITARNNWTRGEIPTIADFRKIETDCFNIVSIIGYPISSSSNNDIIPSSFRTTWAENDVLRLVYYVYNQIEKTIKFMQPTIYWKYKDSEEWYVWYVTKDYLEENNNTINVDSIIRFAGYRFHPLSNIEILGIDSFVPNISSLPDFETIYINVNSTYHYGSVVYSPMKVVFGRMANLQTSLNQFIGRPIENILIPYNMVSIGEGTFGSCYMLSTVEFEERTTTLQIDSSAFAYCTKLTEIELPNLTDKTLNDNLFIGCSTLAKVTLPENLIYITSSAFSNCTALSDLNFKGTMSQWGSITKQTGWNASIPATVVHCSDGDVTL